MSDNDSTCLEAPTNNETMTDKEQGEENTTSSFTNESQMDHDGTDQSMIMSTTVNGIITQNSLKNNDITNGETSNNVPNGSISDDHSSAVPLQQQDRRVLSMLNLLPRKRMREINEEEDEEEDGSNKEKTKVEKLNTPDITMTGNITNKVTGYYIYVVYNL